MAKSALEQHKTVDIVATVLAATEFHQKLIAKINPKIKYESLGKPGDYHFIAKSGKNHGAQTDEFGIPKDERVKIEPLAHYVKKTLNGTTEKWMDKSVCEVVVTKKHKKKAIEAIDYFKGQIVMQVLKGTEIRGFMASLVQVLENEDAFLRDVGILCYVPRTVKGMKAREAKDQFNAGFALTSKPLGAAGSKINVDFTVTHRKELPQYDSYIYEGHDDKGNLVSFWKGFDYAIDFEVGQTYKLSGKIKFAEKSKYAANAIVNNLNYVKLRK